MRLNELLAELGVADTELAALAALSLAMVSWFSERSSVYVGSDYVAFIGDIVRAQQGMVSLRDSADDLVNSGDPDYFLNRLDAQLGMFDSRPRS